MRSLVTDEGGRSIPRAAQADHANVALRGVLDAEIGALKERLRQRSARPAVENCVLARADLERQLCWLRDGLAKLETRRDALS